MKRGCGETENVLPKLLFGKGQNIMIIENIRKRYGKRNVLNGINLETENGMCIGIIGSNGSGKSTLLGILAGTLSSDSGSFCYEGENLFSSVKKSAELVGYVPQNTPLIDELTAKDNLRLWYSADELKKQLSDGVLHSLGIDEFINVPVRKMSGGMKKRLAIGCAVANNPKILLLDEPSAALDLVCKEIISEYLANFKKNGGIILLATHDVQEFPLCDEIYILKNGVLEKYDYDGDISRLAGCL